MRSEKSLFVEITAGGIRWQVQPEFRAALFGPEGIRLEEWLQSGQARVVKDGPHRAVYYVALSQARFYVKHNRSMDFRAWLRQWVRPPKARIEFEHALTVAERNVPSVVPLGVGEPCTSSSTSDSFLITHSLENAQPLGEFLAGVFRQWPPGPQTRFRQRLAGELGVLMARVHDAGIVHRDLHPGNLLVRLQEDRPILYLVDLHAVRIGRPLRWKAARDNLALLNRWFSLRAGRTDRLRFWKAYRLARQTGRLRNRAALADMTLEKTQAVELESRTLHSNLGFWRQRTARCLTTNRYFQSVRSPVARGYAVRDLDPAALAELLRDPDEPFRRPGVNMLKNSPSSTVVELDLTVAGQVRRVIYKRFRVTAWSDPWLSLVRETAAVRSWYHGHGLLDRGLPTARPLAVLHRRRRGLCREGYLVTEKIPNAIELHRFVGRLQEPSSAAKRSVLRRRIEQVAGLVRELHRRNLSQRDLKASNILADVDSDSLWLIDLVGIRCYRHLSRRRRVQNLARLHASFHRHPGLTRADKLRFLRTYLQWGLKGRGSWKKWWREIDAATRAKAARNLRNDRPLG